MRRLVAVAAVVVLAGTPGRAEDWRTYENGRFGTRVEVPAGLDAEPAPENGDGRAWQSADGATRIVVYGNFWGVVSESWDDYRQSFRRRMLQDGAVLTDAGEGDGWFVYSGRLGGGLFHLRVNRSRRCPDIAHHLEVTYPAAGLATWADWAQRMGVSLDEVASAECE